MDTVHNSLNNQNDGIPDDAESMQDRDYQTNSL